MEENMFEKKYYLSVFLIVFLVLMNGAYACAELEAPSLFVSVDGNDVKISWSKIPESKGYTLYFAPYPFVGKIGSINMGDQTSLSVTVWNDAQFYITVRSYDEYEESDYSNIVLYEQDYGIDKIYKSSFNFFQALRNSKGLYRDSLAFDGNQYHPSSIAATGMGLISLCIADKMNWIDNAEKLAEITLKTITGNNPGFVPDRNANGYFRHWINMETGAAAADWLPNNYSSIDTAILIAGALFSKKYFNSQIIDEYADMLSKSVDWGASIADKNTGGIYRTFSEDGIGDTDAISTPFNEYMLVAWFAMNAEKVKKEQGDATVLWNHFYNDDFATFNTKHYQNIDLLTDGDYYLSSFIVQMCYYLCNHFTTSETYKTYMINAKLADIMYWSSLNMDIETCIWGLGAGNIDNNPWYHADAIDSNPELIASPQIIAGFLPVSLEVEKDLKALIQNKKGLYPLPESDDYVLWRFSIENTSWKPTDIQAIDYSFMLFGLSTLPENAGADFFSTYNDFYDDNDDGDIFCTNLKSIEQKMGNVLDITFDKDHCIYAIKEGKLIKSQDPGKNWDEISLIETTMKYPMDLEYYEPENILFIAGDGGVIAYRISNKSFTEIYAWDWDPTRSVSCQRLPNNHIIMATAISSWGARSGIRIYERDNIAFPTKKPFQEAVKRLIHECLKS